MENKFDYHKPIIFKNPYSCPNCGGKLNLYRARDIHENFNVNIDGTIEEENECYDIENEYIELNCKNCNKRYPAYSNINENYNTVYSIDEESSIRLIKSKIKEQTKDKPIVYIEDPFYY